MQPSTNLPNCDHQTINLPENSKEATINKTGKTTE